MDVLVNWQFVQINPEVCMWYPCGVHVILFGVHVISMWCACDTYLDVISCMDLLFNWQVVPINPKVKSACDTMCKACDSYLDIPSSTDLLFKLAGCSSKPKSEVFMWYPCGMHEIPMWCACDTHLDITSCMDLLLNWQVVPMYPALHWHTKSVPPLPIKHVPPFWHGLGKHGSKMEQIKISIDLKW